MDRKLISVALIASALVLVSMVSVGLSYSSVYETEENTCTITCTYGYGVTEVTQIGVSKDSEKGISDLTFSHGGTTDKKLDLRYVDTRSEGRVGINISIVGADDFAESLWTVKLECGETEQVGQYTVSSDGTATIYGFFVDLNGVNTKDIVITSYFGVAKDTSKTMQITIKAIREL